MKPLFDEYGGIIIIALVIAGLVGVIAYLFTGDSFVAQQFQGLFGNLNDLFKNNNSTVTGGSTGGFILPLL